MRSQSAYTLMEVLAALAIMILAGAASLSAMHTLRQHAENDAMRQQILQFIRRARTLVMQQDYRVIVCKSSDLQTCGGSWSEGQLMFVDWYKDKMLHDQRQIVAVNRMLDEHAELHVRFFPRYRDDIEFGGNSITRSDNGTMWYCRNGSQPAWAIKMNRYGKVKALKADADGNVKDSKGKLLEC